MEFEKYAKSLEPKTHCCECVRGIFHTVCIQYPDCDCKQPKEGWGELDG